MSNSFSLDIKALLQPKETKATLYDLIEEVGDIQIDCNGAITSPIEGLALIKQKSHELSVLLNGSIKHLAMVLGHSQEGKVEIDDPLCYFFIIRAVSEAAQELKVFEQICDHALKIKYWPTEVEDIPLGGLLSCLIQLPGVRHSNKALTNLSSFVETASNYTDPQVVNLRIFSEAFLHSHATGEIDANIAGALSFSRQWIGLVEAVQFMRDDAAFQLNNQKAA